MTKTMKVAAPRQQAWSGYVLPVGSNALGRLLVRHLRSGRTAGEALAQARADYPGRGPRDRAMIDSVALIGDPRSRLRGGRL